MSKFILVVIALFSFSVFANDGVTPSEFHKVIVDSVSNNPNVKLDTEDSGETLTAIYYDSVINVDLAGPDFEPVVPMVAGFDTSKPRTDQFDPDSYQMKIVNRRYKIIDGKRWREVGYREEFFSSQDSKTQYKKTLRKYALEDEALVEAAKTRVLDKVSTMVLSEVTVVSESK